VWYVILSLGKAVMARSITARLGTVWYGSLGSERRGTMRIGAAVMARPVTMTLVTSALGTAYFASSIFKLFN